MSEYKSHIKRFNEISPYLDDGIREAVRVLMYNGINTFESCEGKSKKKYFGKEHCFFEPTIKFEGDVFECIRVMDICVKNKLNVFCSNLVLNRIEGVLEKPHGEVVFIPNHETGSIYLKN